MCAEPVTAAMAVSDFEVKVKRAATATVAAGSRILLGLSGGADSVALLRSLMVIPMDIRAVHCNFHLRGEESMRDEAFVRELCCRHGISLTVKDFDTIGHIKEHGGSVEMVCRDLRYAFFREEMRRLGCARIAVAHNADDNVETFLLSLMRGAGLKGLKAMTADNGEIMRPLLEVSRKDIEIYLERIGQDFITDSTNLECDFARNFLRLQVLPLLEQRWPGAKKSITKSIGNLAADFHLLSGFIDSVCSENSLPYGLVADSPAPESLLFHFIRERGGTCLQAMEMARAAKNPRTGAVWILNDSQEVVCGRTAFEIIEREGCIALPGLMVEKLVPTPDVVRAVKIPDGNRTLYLPDDPEGYSLRPRRDGDFILPLGMKGRSLVSDIIKDAKLNAQEARRVCVLENAKTKEIVWIPGLKRSRLHLVDMSSPPSVIFRVSLKSPHANQ